MLDLRQADEGEQKRWADLSKAPLGFKFEDYSIANRCFELLVVDEV